MVQHRQRAALPQPQPAPPAPPDRRAEEKRRQQHHRGGEADPRPADAHVALALEGGAEDGDGAAGRAEAVGHALRELRGQAREAEGVFVVVPVKGLDHVGVEEGFAARDADGEVHDDVGVLGSCGGVAGAAEGGAVAEDGAEPLVDGEHGTHADGVGRVVRAGGDDAGDVGAGLEGGADVDDRGVGGGGGDGLMGYAVVDGGGEGLDAVSEGALGCPGA